MLEFDKITQKNKQTKCVRCYIMEYAILDQLSEASDNNREVYLEKHPEYSSSSSCIEKQEEAFNGSSDTLQFYIFKNYFSKSGIIDLAILLRETPAKGGFGDFKLNNVEVAIYPLYSAKEGAFDITAEVAPPLEKNVEDFIREKRALPKKPYGVEEFDPVNYRWTVNKIAEELGISNRTVAKYCRCKGI